MNELTVLDWQKTARTCLQRQFVACIWYVQRLCCVQDLFLHLTQAVCCHCGKQPKEGALCLQCGTLMCAGDTKCRHPNKQGCCKPHAIVCGASPALCSQLVLICICLFRCCYQNLDGISNMLAKAVTDRSLTLLHLW